MKIEQLVAWVRALRSGKYEKVQGNLQGNKNTFCVLGVLHDLMIQGNWADDYMTTTGVIEHYDLREYGTKIVDMNDQGDDDDDDENETSYDFDQLADYIEENKDGFLGVKHEG